MVSTDENKFKDTTNTITASTPIKPIMNDIVNKKREYQMANIDTNNSISELQQPTKKKKRKTEKKRGQRDGRWTSQEHQAFLDGLELYGREWKKVAENIPTRSSAQIRSHAQKYFSKISKNTVFTQQPSHSDGQGVGSYNVASSDLHGNDNGMRRSTLSSSALEKVANIISNPSSVQQEVESTLKSLHERYTQLQQMIELRNRQQQQRQVVEEVPSSITTVSEEQNNTARGPASAALALQEQEQTVANTVEVTEIPSSSDDRTTISFGSEELIALHVLRTSLKNPESKCPYTTVSSEEEESTCEKNSLDIISDNE